MTKTARMTTIAQKVADESWHFAQDGTPMPCPHLHVGTAQRLLVITGDNASGKSLFVNLMRVWLKETSRAKEKPESLPVTMTMRTSGGLAGSFMFREEAVNSTGSISVRAVEQAFNNMANRTGFLILDEPEVGLAQGYAHALGQYIAQRGRDLPSTCPGTVVVTHNRDLVRGILAGLPGGGRPSFVHLGRNHTLEDWLDAQDTKTVDELLALPEINFERFRALHQHINSAEKG